MKLKAIPKPNKINCSGCMGYNGKFNCIDISEIAGKQQEPILESCTGNDIIYVEDKKG